MLKGKRTKSGMVFIFILMITLLLSGCGLFGPEETTSEPIDPPQNIVDVSEEDEGMNSELDTATEDGETVLVNKEIYLVDANGYVVPLTMPIPEVESIATQVLKYMVKGGPVEAMLPDGFSAVLPEGTTFSIDIKDKLATVDFSKEFTNYAAEDEHKILQAVTWALTQFSTVEKVSLKVNGEVLEEMPVAGTPITEPLSRKDGINMEFASESSPGKTTAVTLYFESENPNGDFRYFVPITRLIPRTDTKDIVKATLQELIKGPSTTSEGLVSAILPTTKIINTFVDKGVAVADFDDTILSYDSNGKASASWLQSVILSLSQTTGAEKVQIMVNGSAEISADGMDLSQPVAAPKSINQVQF
jgi:germination protein M